MKLLHCMRCGDIVRLYSETRACQCGRSKGRYISKTVVTLSGPSRAIGVDTKDVVRGGESGTWHESKRVVRG